ncbi:CST complex subunit TEN1 isoform X1 [Xyrauchen texanus]|uniref:CST complex subunit TEN1 isoform X1 n=1 Tax=Xyrauchen texanus TaxID=154827 RepID=UPI0022427258|nr:CST complex subunit TEN1 isoform X1 [Xyrauchen texanus]
MVHQCERMADTAASSAIFRTGYCHSLLDSSHGPNHAPNISHRLTSYQPEKSIATLSAKQSSAQFHVSVQTSFVEPFQPIIGAQYLVLGEIEKAEGVIGVTLHARALSCIDGVDFTLLQRAIMDQRCFFKERETELNVQASHCEST